MENEAWGVISVVGVWGWMLSVVGFIIKSFPTGGRFNGRSAMIWGGCLIIFYALWVVGMLNA
jgi:hypothetical protein